MMTPWGYARARRDLAVAFVLNLQDCWRTPAFYTRCAQLGLSPVTHARDLEQDDVAGAALAPHGPSPDGAGEAGRHGGAPEEEGVPAVREIA